MSVMQEYFPPQRHLGEDSAVLCGRSACNFAGRCLSKRAAPWPSERHERSEETEVMTKRTLSTVFGAAIASSLGSVVTAGENPFTVRDLTNGYLHVAEAGKEQKEMVCGEGKCGASMMKTPEMNCGAMKADAKKKEEEEKKAMEGKCAGMKMDTPAATPAQEPPKVQ